MAKLKTPISGIELETINHLVKEVTKNKPDQSVVKKLMLQAGLDYQPDLIQQMGAVLALVSQISPDTKKALAKKPREVDL
jgi:hypothetical protein